MAGSIYDRMMGPLHYDSNAGTSALNAAANAFQGMASTFHTMRQSIIDEEQKNLQREMEKQHHQEEMDYKDRSLAQDYKQHTERLEFDRLKHADDKALRERELDQQWRIANLRASGGGGGGGRGGGRGRKGGGYSEEGAWLQQQQGIWDDIQKRKAASTSAGNTQNQSQSTSQPSTPIQKPSISIGGNKDSDTSKSPTSNLLNPDIFKTPTITAKPLGTKDDTTKRAEMLIKESQADPNSLFSVPLISKPLVDASLPPKTDISTSSKGSSKQKTPVEVQEPSFVQDPKMPNFDLSSSRTTPLISRGSLLGIDPVSQRRSEVSDTIDNQIKSDRADFLRSSGILDNNRAYSYSDIDDQFDRFSQLPRQEQLNQLSRNTSGRTTEELGRELDRLAFPSRESLSSGIGTISSPALTRPSNPSSDSVPQSSPLNLSSRGDKIEQAGIEEVGKQAKIKADDLYALESKGMSVLGVPTNTGSIDFDPNVMPSDADIFNANPSSFKNLTPQAEELLMGTRPALNFNKTVSVDLVKRDSQGNLDKKATDLNVANYAGRVLATMGKQERYHYMKLCYYLANRPEYRGTDAEVRFKAIGKALQDSFDINIDTNDYRYRNLLVAKTYGMLGGSENHIYENGAAAEKSINDERLAVEKRQGLRTPGTVNSNDLQSLTGFSKLDQITQTGVKEILNDPFSNPIVSRYLYSKGKDKFTNRHLKIAATAYLYAMMGTWNREAEDRVFKRPDQVRRFFYDAADKKSSTHKDIEDAFLKATKILEKGGSL